MTPALAPAPAPEDEWAEGPTLLRADALCLAGFASLCAGAIHAAAIGAHSDHDQAVLVFTIVAGFQLVWGALAVARSSRLLALTGAVGHLALVAGWIVAKRSGLGFIDGLVARERKIGRAAWRERVCQYVWISGVAVSLKKKNNKI